MDDWACSNTYACYTLFLPEYNLIKVGDGLSFYVVISTLFIIFYACTVQVDSFYA